MTIRRNQLACVVTLLLSFLLIVGGGVAAEPAVPPAPAGDDGKPPLIGGTPADTPVFVDSLEQQQEPSATTAPIIEVWYGLNQSYGSRLNHRSDPQKWVNIVGNVTPAAGVSVSYSLNGGSPVPLTLGPDDRRLAQLGDFNAEIDYTDLQTGPNQVVITANGAGGQDQETVTINYGSGSAWTLGTHVFNWSGSINNTAQVVDGEWKLDGGGVRPIVFDYDRLIALGDMSWRDYTVTVPVTIFGINEDGNGPGVGFLTRWSGHFPADAGVNPQTGWTRLGGLGWYRWQNTVGGMTEGLQLIGNNNKMIGENGKQLEFNVTYNFKMKITSPANSNAAATYSFKVWPANQPEPAAWDIEGQGGFSEPSGGSVVLVAHHADVRFGPVTVDLVSTRPQPTLALSTTGAGTGSVVPTPSGPTYRFGEDVLLTADPDTGSIFSNWSGYLTGTTNPVWLEMFENRSVTAQFNKYTQSTFAVSVSANGAGQVTKSPNKATYNAGEKVTLTAIPEGGNTFVNWSGSLTGSTNPVIVTVNKNMTVVGNFTGAPLHTLEVAVQGEGEVTWNPNKAAFLNGEFVTLTATPIGNAQFIGWSGDAGGSTNPLTIEMNSNKSITAIFTASGYSNYLPSIMRE